MMRRPGRPQKQIQHFDNETGEYYYSCGCKECKHEMLWPRSMFVHSSKRKWNVSNVTYECQKYTEYLTSVSYTHLTLPTIYSV